MKVITEGLRYELSQVEPVPDLKPLKGLAKDCYDACLLIEKLPASEQQTEAIIAVSELLKKLLEREYGHQVIQFIEKKTEIVLGEKNMSGAVQRTVTNGVCTEEVLEMVLDHLVFVNKQAPCREYSLAITNVEQGLGWLNRRTEKLTRTAPEAKAHS